jgi:hypothetical protein
MPRKGRGAKAGHRELVGARQADAMRLRIAGASFAQIARQLGTSKQQSFRDVRAALAETLNHRDVDAAAYRELELSRLDALLVAVWPHAQKGSAEHVRAAVRIGERRARLLGLDAAVASKLDMSGHTVVDHRWSPEDQYTGLSMPDLLARADVMRTGLRLLVEAEAVAAPVVVDADPVALTVEERYERVLRDRRRSA